MKNGVAVHVNGYGCLLAQLRFHGAKVRWAAFNNCLTHLLIEYGPFELNVRECVAYFRLSVVGLKHDHFESDIHNILRLNVLFRACYTRSRTQLADMPN